MRPVSLFFVLSAFAACSGTDTDTATGDTGTNTDTDTDTVTDIPTDTNTDTDVKTDTDTGTKKTTVLTGANAIKPGQLVVSEIHHSPLAVADGVGEWFELHNPSKVKINLNGLVVFDGVEYFGVYDDITIEPGDFAIFARNGDQATNGGVVADYVFGTTMSLDLDDTINLGNDFGSLDTVRWNPTDFDLQNGAALSLSSSTLNPTDNDVAANWCLARGLFGRGDRGSPGFPNPDCDVDPKKETGMTGDTGTVPSPAESINPGDLVVTEVMQNPVNVDDSDGEWFEIYNTTDADIDIRGLEVGDNASNSFVVPWDPDKGAAITVPTNGYFVFGANATTADNGGVTVDYEYSRTHMVLGNGPDEVVLSNSAGVIDEIAYDGAKVSWPDPAGKSMNLTSTVLDATGNDAGGSWCEATVAIDSTDKNSDLGTPGDANSNCAP